MLNSLSRTHVILVWFVVIALTVGASLLAGATATPTTWGLLLLISLVPPAIAFVIWRAPQPTVAEVLYGVEHPR